MHVKYKVVPAGDNESHVYEVYRGKYKHVFTGDREEVEDWLADQNSHLSQAELLDYFADVNDSIERGL